MYKLKRIEFFIIKKCINRCVFCSEKDKFDGTELKLEAVKKTLASQRRKGVGLVHFMGGEPTIHSQFPKILVLAKALGYRTYIITNGIKFADRKFCEAAAPYLDEVMVSVHGYNAQTHDANTRNPGSFVKMAAGLKNLADCPNVRLTATTSITRLNFRHLKKIVQFTSRFAIKENQFISIIPSGDGRRNFLDVIPRLSELRTPAAEAIALCEKSKTGAMFAGVPMCVLGKHFAHSSDLRGEFKVDNLASHDNKLKLWKEPEIEQDDFRIDIGRIKTAKCGACAKAGVCGGLYQLYFARYGDAELKPFRRPARA